LLSPIFFPQFALTGFSTYPPDNHTPTGAGPALSVAAFASMTPHENGTLFDGSPFDNNIGPVPNYPTSSATTAADGTFHDVPFGACSPTPIYTPLTATQNITILVGGNSYRVRTQTWSVSAPGSSSFGRGTIQNAITYPGTGSNVSATR